jgi:hypothetical protein
MLYMIQMTIDHNRTEYRPMGSIWGSIYVARELSKNPKITRIFVINRVTGEVLWER